MKKFGLLDNLGKVINLVNADQESNISNPDNLNIVDLTNVNIGTDQYWNTSTSTIINCPNVISDNLIGSTGSTDITNIHLTYDRNISNLGTLQIQVGTETVDTWTVSNQILTDSGSTFDIEKNSTDFLSGSTGDVHIIPLFITDADGRSWTTQNQIDKGIDLIHNFSLVN